MFRAPFEPVRAREAQIPQDIGQDGQQLQIAHQV